MNPDIIAVKSGYFRPCEGYEHLVDTLISYCENGDFVIISETPISTIEGNLVDESDYESGVLSYIITEVWCKYLWGYILCPLLGYSSRSIRNLRKMPVEAIKHKEFILRRYGLKHALQPTAEAGVDLSNVPGNYVSLLPENPAESACTIKELIYEKSGKNVEIIIIDTDPTYKIGNMYFTTLPKSVPQIRNNTGIFGYFLRSFSKKIGATPLSTTVNLNLEYMIELTNMAEECQKENSDSFFETIYDMKDTFNTGFNEITVDMLDSISHIPAVIIRKQNYL